MKIASLLSSSLCHGNPSLSFALPRLSSISDYRVRHELGDVLATLLGRSGAQNRYGASMFRHTPMGAIRYSGSDNRREKRRGLPHVYPRRHARPVWYPHRSLQPGQPEDVPALSRADSQRRDGVLALPERIAHHTSIGDAGCVSGNAAGGSVLSTSCFAD